MGPMPCLKYYFLGCSLPQENTTCYNPDFNCMARHFDSLSSVERKILIEDAAREGYSFLGIEDFIHRINRGGGKAVRSDGSIKDISRLLSSYPLVPNPKASDMDFLDKVNNIPYHHCRGSQFSSTKCPLSVLYSNLDEVKLFSVTEKKPKVMPVALAGDIRHRMVAEPGLAHEHEEYSGFKAKREEYCEKRVAYSFSVKDLESDLDSFFAYMMGDPLDIPLWDMSNMISERKNYKKWFEAMDLDWRESGNTDYCIKGTADGILSFEGRGGVVILDWKRSRHFKNSYAFQMAAYALAVEQLSGSVYDSYHIICAINRQSNSSREYNLSGKHIMRIEKDDILLHTMRLKTVFMHSVIRTLIEKPDIFLGLRNSQRKKRFEKDGHPANRCDILYGGIPCIAGQSGLCDIIYDYVKVGNSLSPLMIDGFQV